MSFKGSSFTIHGSSFLSSMVPSVSLRLIHPHYYWQCLNNSAFRSQQTYPGFIPGPPSSRSLPIDQEDVTTLCLCPSFKAESGYLKPQNPLPHGYKFTSRSAQAFPRPVLQKLDATRRVVMHSPLLSLGLGESQWVEF